MMMMMMQWVLMVVVLVAVATSVAFVVHLRWSSFRLVTENRPEHSQGTPSFGAREANQPAVMSNKVSI